MRPDWQFAGKKVDGSGLNIFSCFNCDRRCLVEVSSSSHEGPCPPDKIAEEFSRFQLKEYPRY